jgi:hypothetical protein
MHIDKRWLLLLALAGIVAAAAAAASKSRRRPHHNARVVEDNAAVRSWENEGGHPMPIPSASAPP